MKQGEGHMLLGVLAGSWEASFSQNNKRQICEAYVRRNRNLLLISFQLKKKMKKKIRNLLFSAPQVHPELVILFASAFSSFKPCLPCCLALLGCLA